MGTGYVIKLVFQSFLFCDMKRANLYKFLLIAILSSLVIVAIVVLSNTSEKYLLPTDYSHSLSTQEEIIEVSLIQWACDCAEWKVLGEDIPVDSLEHYSIFIESAHAGKRIELAELDNNCWPVKLKLTGRFFLDNGISRDYEVMFEKPRKARVFQYQSFEIIETDCPLTSTY